LPITLFSVGNNVFVIFLWCTYYYLRIIIINIFNVA